MGAPMIVAEGLGRWYGQVVGLSDVSLSLDARIVGLLGPNGAGKSTFIRLVTGQIRPSRGRIQVLSEDPFANEGLYRRMGYCPDGDAVYDDMTGEEMLRFLLRLQGYAAGESRDRARQVLDRLGLSDASGRAARGYSRGMRQRLKLAQAVAHEPEILVLDEPLTGLDPVGRKEVIAFLRSLADRGTRLLVSSHVLHEVEALTEEVVLIHKGRILAEGSVGRIRELLDRHPRKLRLEADRPRELAPFLAGLPAVQSVSVDDATGGVLVETRQLEEVLDLLPGLVAERSPGLRSLQSTDAGLEAVFDYLLG